MDSCWGVMPTALDHVTENVMIALGFDTDQRRLIQKTNWEFQEKQARDQENKARRGRR